jgi:hypothetical protein
MKLLAEATLPDVSNLESAAGLERRDASQGGQNNSREIAETMLG